MSIFTPAVIGSLIGGGLGLAGSMLEPLGGILTNSANAEQAHKNRLHQIRMAKNRYQWMVEDLRKAGINPIYSVQGGSAPSIGSGSAIPMQNPIKDNPFRAALGTAADLQKMKNDKAIADSQVFLNKASAEAHLSSVLYNNAKTSEQVIKNKYLDDYSKGQIMEMDARAQSAIWRNLVDEAEGLNATRYYQQRSDKMMYDAWTAKNQYESLKSPKWNRGVGYVSDAFGLAGDAVSSALGFGKLTQMYKLFNRARGW